MLGARFLNSYRKALGKEISTIVIPNRVRLVAGACDERGGGVIRHTILWIGGERALTVVGFAVILAGMLWFAATAPPTSMSSSAAFAQYHPGAVTTTSSDRSTFNASFLSCTGESVQIQGTLHTVAHTTTDANGERHTTFHFNIQGRGESESGAKYVYNDVFSLHENFPAGDPNFNVTFTRTVKLIRQGSATPKDDMEANLLIHQTLNSQGDLTSEILKAESECT
jgi:hypothetical protein